MTAMTPLRPILNDTPANATDVDWNFQAIGDYITTDVIKRDGSVAMEAPLNLLGPPPSLPTHAITKGYVDSVAIPVGTIWEFAGAVAPAGWAFCDGASKSTTDPAYAALFALIQYAYGGSGGNFSLPDKRGRVGVGRSQGDALFGTLGQSGGSRNLIIPSHTHGLGSHIHAMADHLHGMAGHSHWMEHTHPHPHVHNSPLRTGYDVNSANGPGSTNAILTPSGTPLSFLTRPTAATETQLGGGAQFNTGQPADNAATGTMSGSGPAANGHTNPPNVANTTGMTAAANTGAATGNTADANGGVSPANGNLQPYVTVNFIIRIG